MAAQQARFDAFIAELNTERPHEALDMATPASRYTPSTRRFTGLPELTYPLHDIEITVEIHARNEDGFTDNVIRTVSENARTLKIDPHGFERD